MPGQVGKSNLENVSSSLQLQFTDLGWFAGLVGGVLAQRREKIRNDEKWILLCILLGAPVDSRLAYLQVSSCQFANTYPKDFSCFHSMATSGSDSTNISRFSIVVAVREDCTRFSNGLSWIGLSWRSFLFIQITASDFIIKEVVDNIEIVISENL